MRSGREGTAGDILTDRLLKVFGTGAALVFLLVCIRMGGAGRAWRPFRPLGTMRELVVLGYYDIIYVAVVCGVFAAGLVLTRRWPRVQQPLEWLFFAVALFSILMACVNEKALRELGRPLTYQWLYYSDFLRSLDAYNAMAALVTWSWLKTAMTRCLWLVGLSYVAVRGLRALAGCVRLPWLATPLLAGIGLALGMEHRWVTRVGAEPGTRQNPVVALVASAIDPDEQLLTTMPTSVPPTDVVRAGDRPVSEGALGMVFRERARSAGVRNVLIIVLESVAAQYVGAYGAPYGATPYLDGYRSKAMRFTNIYAHVPTSVHSLISLLLSVYHPHSFRVLTKEYPRARLASLSGELEQGGYRTAFFNGADNRFQHEDIFLHSHRFGELFDYRSIGCAGLVFRGSDKEWPYLDGIADECAAKEVGTWAGQRSAAPFFSVFWTMQTHFPYFLTRPATEFGVPDSTMNRYLNALRETDQAVGALLAGLERRGLLDSTLVVVLGDHGEAFGQHKHFVHGVDLYEEEVHVPLMLINPQLFHGETDSTVGGVVDIAPTIMDILGRPLPQSWQGRSLFDGGRSGRAYLFTPRSEVLFGYREGQRKFIYDASNNVPELYDLKADPAELVNIAAGSPAYTQQAERRLAAWVQYQGRFFKDVLVPDAR